MPILGASWRTSLLGVLTILAALAGAGKAYIDGDPATNPDWTATTAAITAGLGLLRARDNQVSSEQAGAK